MKQLRRRATAAAIGALVLLATLISGAAPPAPYSYLAGFTSKVGAQGGLTLAPDGNYYGTFSTGGANGNGGLFELSMDSSGQSSVRMFYSFSATDSSNHNADGAKPRGSLALSNDGTLLYGTTPFGGVFGQGVLFSVQLPTAAAPMPVPTTLGSFGASSLGNGFTGNFPDGNIVVGSDGTLYGAASGGASFNGQIWLYNGAPGVLHDMSAQSGPTGNADGEFPRGLVLAPDGLLWGVCSQGGPNGSGTVFSLSTSGQYNVVHAYSAAPANSAGFPVNSDGAFPLGLSFGFNSIGAGFQGYIITSYGGVNGLGAFGTVVGSNFTVLGSLPGVDSSNNNTGGATPAGPPLIDAQGTIYQNFSFGGPNGNGALSQIVLPNPANPAAVLTLNPLHVFTGLDSNGFNADGAGPAGPDLFAGFNTGIAGTPTPDNGIIFGVTSEGGPYGYGGIYEYEAYYRPPTIVSLVVSPATITLGQNAQLTWSSTNALSCEAGGAWQGDKALDGTVNVAAPEAGTYTFLLTCKGYYGSAQGTTVLTVVEPGSSSGSSSGGSSSGASSGSGSSSGSSSSGGSSSSSSGSSSSSSSSGGSTSSSSGGNGGSSSSGGGSSSGGPSTVSIGTSGGQVTVSTSAGTFTQSGVAAAPTGASGQLGLGQSTPFGFIGFTISGAPPSTDVTVTIAVPLGMGQTLAGYQKCTGMFGCIVLNKVGASVGNVTVTGINGNTLTLSCTTDNSGNCEDPGAPVVQTSSGNDGGGSFGWSGLLGLALLRARRRRAGSAAGS